MPNTTCVVLVCTVLLSPLALAQPPADWDPFDARTLKYVPSDFRQSIQESPSTLISALKHVLPAILDALPLSGLEERLALEKQTILHNTPTRYSEGFRSTVSEYEKSRRYRSVSINVRSYTTFRETELEFARSLAGLPVEFPKCSESFPSVGELCYWYQEGGIKQIRFLRKNVFVDLSIRDSRSEKGAKPERQLSDPLSDESSALCEEAARKIDNILIRYVPPVAP